MDSLGIIFELQWKRKQGVGNRSTDIASLGIWDTADSSLDWKTFKSYLSQNLGTQEEISVAYVDSEGDEIPIESECEFREALKFARQRARRGHNIVLKVDKDEIVPAPLAEVPEKKRWRRSKLDKSKSAADKPFKKVLATEWEDLQTYNSMLVDKLANMKMHDDEQKKSKCEKEEAPPAWFKKYMQKMKAEIVAEVNSHTRQLLAGLLPPEPSVGRKSKKRTSDEDSSDTGPPADHRDHKLVRKIEKLHKFQKKWDCKLEKLESKTRRLVEKKRAARKRSTVQLMDAVALSDASRATHIALGKRFTKIWEVTNNGTLPWTDKTELRLAWGTLGLEPELPAVKCPLLEPGEKGQIAVTFRAPDFPGTFESYWHFYHAGERFGHWVGCSVLVEAEKPSRLAEPSEGKQVDTDIDAGNSSSNNNNNINASRNPRPEYDSGSDDDDLSLVSAISSDSDDDEQFVMVPMPACFLLNNTGFSEPTEEAQVSSAPSALAERVSAYPTENAWSTNETNQVLLDPPSEMQSTIQTSLVSLDPPSMTQPTNNVSQIQPDTPKMAPLTLATESWPTNEMKVSSEKGCTDVHILPETIMNGAINVASSAYNKAQALIGHLRSKQPGDRGDVMTTSQCLALLAEMGFNSRAINTVLLQRFDNDVDAVVAELVREAQR